MFRYFNIIFGYSNVGLEYLNAMFESLDATLSLIQLVAAVIAEFQGHTQNGQLDLV